MWLLPLMSARPLSRHKMFEEYKGTRKAMPEELRQQVPVMKEVLEAMDIKILEKEGYEADDILGTLGRRFEEIGGGSVHHFRRQRSPPACHRQN